MSKPNKAAPRSYPVRRTFTVKEQLLGKLGPGPFGRLLDQLGVVAKPRRSRRKAVS